MTRSLRGVYPGSFDPITNGHLDILERSLNLFSEITILVAESPRKNGLFSTEERVELIRAAVGKRKNVKVDHWNGLIMNYARENGIQAVIRGLRAASDFEYEFMMAAMNKELNPEVETVFMMTSQNLFFISSSTIRELAYFGGDFSPYVPKVVAAAMKKRIHLNRKASKK